MFPNSSEAIPVNCVADEYAYVSAHTCPGCGGRWTVQMQALFQDEQGRKYDRVHVICSGCARRQAFVFDINSFFHECRVDG